MFSSGLKVPGLKQELKFLSWFMMFPQALRRVKICYGVHVKSVVLVVGK